MIKRDFSPYKIGGFNSADYYSFFFHTGIAVWNFPLWMLMF